MANAPEPVIGQIVRGYISRELLPWLRRERVVGVTNGSLRQTDGGKVIDCGKHQPVPRPWDILKVDGANGKLWLRPSKLIHRAGGSSATYELSGDGSDTAGSGLTITSGTRIVSAKLTVPTSVTLTLHESATIPTDTTTAVYWPLWEVVYDSGSGVVRPVQRFEDTHIKATVWQLLAGWDATKVQALDHNTSGVLTWTDSDDC